MLVAQVQKAGAPFELVERPIPEPGAGQVQIKVEACGICHSDVVVKDGLFPDALHHRHRQHADAGRGHLRDGEREVIVIAVGAGGSGTSGGR